MTRLDRNLTKCYFSGNLTKTYLIIMSYFWKRIVKISER